MTEKINHSIWGVSVFWIIIIFGMYASLAGGDEKKIEYCQRVILDGNRVIREMNEYNSDSQFYMGNFGEVYNRLDNLPKGDLMPLDCGIAE